jgi:hypothetical protein
VCVSVDYTNRTFQTIGGNENGRGAGSAVQIKEYSMDSKNLVGIAKPIFPDNFFQQGNYTRATLESLTGKIAVGERTYQLYETPPTPPTT